MQNAAFHPGQFCNICKCICLFATAQVPWYAVLGNHDYGDGIKEGVAPPRCPSHTRSACFPGPLHQACPEPEAHMADQAFFSVVHRRLMISNAIQESIYLRSQLDPIGCVPNTPKLA